MDVEGAEIIDQPTQPSDKPRITTRYMTKYERARILGTRALQIRSADEHSISSRARTFLCSLRFFTKYTIPVDLQRTAGLSFFF